MGKGKRQLLREGLKFEGQREKETNFLHSKGMEKKGWSGGGRKRGQIGRLKINRQKPSKKG